MNVVRIAARVLGGLLALLLVAVLLVIAHGFHILHHRPGNHARALAVATDSALVAHGEHLARINCAGCHSANMQPPLSGGEEDFLGAPGGPPFGHLKAPNLTPGGRLAQYTDAQLVRAIREGVGRDEHALIVMPSLRFQHLSDNDVAAIVAYLRSQPAVPSHATPREISPLGYLILGLKLFPPSNGPEITQPVTGPERGASAEYGEYLARFLTCQDCHGETLHGGAKGQFAPLGPDLVALASSHSLQEFEGGVRQGRSPRDGHSLDPTKMPYPLFANLDDTEVAALYEMLRAGGIRKP